MPEPTYTAYTFKKDKELSYDGLRTKVYEKGKTYKPTHPQEAIVLLSLSKRGVCDVATGENAEDTGTDRPAPKRGGNGKAKGTKRPAPAPKTSTPQEQK